jgi:PIN domain nuclease of toxin-antitoxin system
LTAYVLDASALLAALHEEVGSDIVTPLIGDSVMSSVNWSEVMQKSLARRVDVAGLRNDLQALGFMIVPFTREDAEITAALWSDTRKLGLSLADRACLALGKRLKLSVLTADRVWSKVVIGMPIRVIRS